LLPTAEKRVKLATRGIVVAGLAVRDQLDSKYRDGREQQYVDETAFVHHKFQYEPDDQEDGANYPHSFIVPSVALRLTGISAQTSIDVELERVSSARDQMSSATEGE
jgi:hypothetical protein